MNELFEHFAMCVSKRYGWEVIEKTHDTIVTSLSESLNETVRYVWEVETTNTIENPFNKPLCIIKRYSNADSSIPEYVLLQKINKRLVSTHFLLGEQTIHRRFRKIGNNGLFFRTSSMELIQKAKPLGDQFQEWLIERPQYRLLHCTGELKIKDQ